MNFSSSSSSTSIDSRLAQKVIDQSVEETALAEKVAMKGLNKYHDLEGFKLRQKLYAYLARRGFSWETIKKTLDLIIKKG